MKLVLLFALPCAKLVSVAMAESAERYSLISVGFGGSGAVITPIESNTKMPTNFKV